MIEQSSNVTLTHCFHTCEKKPPIQSAQEFSPSLFRAFLQNFPSLVPNLLLIRRQGHIAFILIFNCNYFYSKAIRAIERLFRQSKSGPTFPAKKTHGRLQDLKEQNWRAGRQKISPAGSRERLALIPSAV